MPLLAAAAFVLASTVSELPRRSDVIKLVRDYLGPVETDAHSTQFLSIQFQGVRHYAVLTIADPSSKDGDPEVSELSIAEQLVPKEHVSERRVYDAFRRQPFRLWVRIDGVVGLSQHWSLPLTKDQVIQELGSSLSFVNQFVQTQPSLEWTVAPTWIRAPGPSLSDNLTVDLLDDGDLQEMIAQWGYRTKKGGGRTGAVRVLVSLNVGGIECWTHSQQTSVPGEGAQDFRMAAEVPVQSLSDALTIPGFQDVSVERVADRNTLTASWSVRNGRTLSDIRDSWKRFAEAAKKLGAPTSP